MDLNDETLLDTVCLIIKQFLYPFVKEVYFLQRLSHENKEISDEKQGNMSFANK